MKEIWTKIKEFFATVWTKFVELCEVIILVLSRQWLVFVFAFFLLLGIITQRHLYELELMKNDALKREVVNKKMEYYSIKVDFSIITSQHQIITKLAGRGIELAPSTNPPVLLYRNSERPTLP